jgi:hypothetical protein
VRIANDSEYGLGGFVDSEDGDRATAIARRLETGSVGVNADLSFHGPGILDNVAAELNARPRKRVEGDHRKFVVLFIQHGTNEADQGGVADREDTTKTTGPQGYRQSRTSSRHGQHQ